ncbi:MAG: hypothetical protein ACR2K6_02500, partial [Solirubrobacterales bacterium]
EPPFEPDRWHERYLLTQNPRGYLRRTGEGAGEPRPERPASFLIGSLELSGVNGFEIPPPETALQDLTAAAGEPDLEVEALRKSLTNVVRGQREDDVDAELAKRHQEMTVEGLLREIDVQRELLQERNRLLMRERNRLRRITGSLPYRIYRKLRAAPLLSRWFHWRDRHRLQDAKTRSIKRSETRDHSEQRFSEHHRGQ